MALSSIADGAAAHTFQSRMILDLLPSFNAGELDPRMDARAGLDKYQAGCRTLKNFIPSPFGGASKRPGMIYKATLADASLKKRLIPFRFSSSYQYVIALRVSATNTIAIEVFREGALVFSGSNVFGTSSNACVTEAELWELQHEQINDVVIFTHPSYAPFKLTRTSDTSWTFGQLWQTDGSLANQTDWPPLRDENTDSAKRLTLENPDTGGNLDASAAVFDADMTVANSPISRGFFALAWANQGTSVKLQVNSLTASINDSAWLSVIGTWNAYSFNYWDGAFEIHRSYDNGATFEIIRHYKGIAGTRNWTTGGSEIIACKLRLRLVGNRIAAGTDPDAFAVIEQAEQRQWALVVVTGFVNSTRLSTVLVGGSIPTLDGTVTITNAAPAVFTWANHGLLAGTSLRLTTTGSLPTGLATATTYYVISTGLTANTFQVSATYGGTAINTSSAGSGVHTAKTLAPTYIWSEGAFSRYRGFPRTVKLHQDRLFFGGNASEALRLWGSVQGDFFNFRRTSLADASIAATIGSQQSNEIQWLASSRGALIVGTSGDEHVVTAPNDGILAPNNLKAETQSSYGSAYVAPVAVNYATLFLQRSKARVREFVFSQEVQGYVAPDMTRLSNILVQPGIKQWDLQRSLDTIVWGVTTDGKLVGMTYEREENVVGWHRHETDGTIESVAVIYGAEGASDEVYLSVKRTIGGSPVRYLEVLDPLAFANQRDGNTSDLVLVDSAKTVTGVGLTTATGLSHLNGKTVQIVADGTRRNDGTVSGGSVAISGAAANKVVVGIAFEALLKPMKIEVPMRDGTAQMRHMKLTRLAARLWKSLGGEMRADDDASWETLGYPQSTLYTGDLELSLSAKTLPSLEFAIRSNDPLPLTILALVPKFDVSGQ